jgi:hypothetical protein
MNGKARGIRGTRQLSWRAGGRLPDRVATLCPRPFRLPRASRLLDRGIDGRGVAVVPEEAETGTAKPAAVSDIR